MQPAGGETPRRSGRIKIRVVRDFEHAAFAGQVFFSRRRPTGSSATPPSSTVDLCE